MGAKERERAILREARCRQQELAYVRGEAEEKPYLSIETGYIRRRISEAAVSCFGQRPGKGQQTVAMEQIIEHYDSSLKDDDGKILKKRT